MLDGLKPYPAYRKSGVPWLGKMPAHWDVRRGKALFARMDRPPRQLDDVVTCFRDGVVTLRKNRRVSGFTESLKEIGYQGIRRGDLVIHAMDAFAGAIGVADSDGKGTPVYSVCKARQGVDPGFFALVLREMARSEWILALAKGIRERSTDFRFEAFGAQLLPVPPVQEQSAIARYLDHAERRIRQVIRIRLKLIRLLGEESAGVVHRLVTRGLEPTARFSDSGVAWYGPIPQGWQVVSLGRVIRSAVDGPHHSPTYVDEGIPFLSARSIKVDRWSLGDVKFISEADFKEFSRRVVPERGDVLYTKGGTTGVARVVDLDFPFQVWVHVAVLKVEKSRILPSYLALLLNSPRCYEQSQLLTRGATNQDLGLNRMKQILFPLPPLCDQEAILRHAREVLEPIAVAVEAARREISLATELRTRLIADVVTGKFDVREIAALLPLEAETADSSVVDDDGETEEPDGPLSDDSIAEADA